MDCRQAYKYYTTGLGWYKQLKTSLTGPRSTAIEAVLANERWNFTECIQWLIDRFINITPPSDFSMNSCEKVDLLSLSDLAERFL